LTPAEAKYDSDYPLLGYRKFRILGPQWGIPEHSLVGCHKSAPWPPKEPMVARCLPFTLVEDCDDGPIAQSKHCKCGLHIYFTLEDAKDYAFCSGSRGHVIAMCAGGGRVLFDAKYARCQIAEVLCLIDPVDYLDAKPEKTEWLSEWSRGAAKKYGVPVLRHFDAIDFVSEIGLFVSGVRGESDDLEAVVEGLDN
jgi:hypothetical protein